MGPLFRDVGALTHGLFVLHLDCFVSGLCMKDLTFLSDGNPDYVAGGVMNLQKRKQVRASWLCWGEFNDTCCCQHKHDQYHNLPETGLIFGNFHDCPVVLALAHSFLLFFLFFLIDIVLYWTQLPASLRLQKTWAAKNNQQFSVFASLTIIRAATTPKMSLACHEHYELWSWRVISQTWLLFPIYLENLAKKCAAWSCVQSLIARLAPLLCKSE